MENDSILDINPLEHLTGDIAQSQHNYESILNGLVNWNNSKDDKITIRLMTNSAPFFRDIELFTRYYYTKASGSVFSEKLLGGMSFAYNSRYRIVAAINEGIVFRVSARDLGGVQWKLYEDASLYDEFDTVPNPLYGDAGYNEYVSHTTFSTDYVKGVYVRYYDDSNQTVKLCRVDEDVTAGTLIDQTNLVDVVLDVTSTAGVVPSGSSPELVLYDGKVYIKQENVQGDPVKPVNNPASGYEVYCDVYPDATEGDDEQPAASYGECYYFHGEFFVYINEHPSTMAPFNDADDGNLYVRRYNTDFWKPVYLKPTRYTVNGDGVLRFRVDTDINGFVLKNISSAESGERTESVAIGSVKIDGGRTREHSGVDVFTTSNYVEWPGDAPKWVGVCNNVNENLNAYSLQPYSAVMVFSHADPSVKQRNIINYDGPDLDQGLCIMLPCEVTVEENGVEVVKKPSDGMTFDFVINIWPNHAYDGREFNDLIINKSQVYVYSVRDWSYYKDSGMSVDTVTPIAKFSMARLLNFYVHDENVGVPDRPVVYKASFIYSSEENRWKTYDYYQLPDHILLSPFGFVDPMDKKAYDVQSAGFPLFQNPFSNYDLSPIHVSENYRNQLQEDPRTSPT